MGLHCSFEHLKHKLWPKEMSGVKLTVWLPTIKSRESTRFLCVQATCDTLLKRSRRGLQLFFRPHLDRRFAHEVMRLQGRESPSCWNFEIPTWEFQDKKTIWMWSPWRGAEYTIRGKVVASPSSGRGSSCVFELLVVRLSTKSALTMH
jgi:hypothetical protein